mmetsp:Transcript_7811/g.10170  ORF Transcript_7811/g.10170 Transcript_7811/m.10170 type:complete len:112 (-) Transcript_7811:617-952(-)
MSFDECYRKERGNIALVTGNKSSSSFSITHLMYAWDCLRIYFFKITLQPMTCVGLMTSYYPQSQGSSPLKCPKFFNPPWRTPRSKWQCAQQIWTVLGHDSGVGTLLQSLEG